MPSAANPVIRLSGSEHVLVVLMGSLGDVARGLSIVEPLREALPKGTISWLVEPACAPLVRLHPRIDSVLVFERHRPAGGFLALAKELRKQRFDISLDLQRHFKSGLFSKIAGAPCRIGFAKQNAKEGNPFFQTASIAAFPADSAKQKFYYSFLSAIGLRPPKLDEYGLRQLKPTPLASEVIGLLGGDYTTVVMGSSWRSKDWPEAHYRRLLQGLLDTKDRGVLLVGGLDQVNRAERVIAGADSRAVNMTGKTSLPDLCGLLEHARCVIGPDSGPGHLASLLGAPVVSLFGPTSPQRTAPVGSEALVLQASLGCVPCYRRRCPGLSNLCLELLAPEDVLAAHSAVITGH